jgi:hypothetical protein
MNYKLKLIVKDMSKKVKNHEPDSLGKEIFGIQEFGE